MIRGAAAEHINPATRTGWFGSAEQSERCANPIRQYVFITPRMDGAPVGDPIRNVKQVDKMSRREGMRCM
ncbi:hypothetical protein VZT92_014026 [Zoarces viviparus]|uniref:Uncharacterized protein n=1 Tax=Zoarces viviparus TaxID=48416 RepID=A0AAW1EXS1_ZOAVI